MKGLVGSAAKNKLHLLDQQKADIFKAGNRTNEAHTVERRQKSLRRR